MVGKNSRYFVGVFNTTIIPLALVGYVMIIANSYPTRARGIIVKCENRIYERVVKIVSVFGRSK